MLRRRTKTTKKAHEKKDEPVKHKKHVLDVKVRKVRRHPSAARAVKVGRANKDNPEISVREAPVYASERPDFRDDQIDRYKTYITLSGVGFFMLLIIFVWSINVNKIIQAGTREFAENEAGMEEVTREFNDNLEKLKQGVDQFKEVKVKLDELKDYSATVTTTLEKSPPALPDTGSSSQPGFSPSRDLTKDPQQIVEKKLEILEENLEELAESGSSAPKIKN